MIIIFSVFFSGLSFVGDLRLKSSIDKTSGEKVLFVANVDASFEELVFKVVSKEVEVVEEGVSTDNSEKSSVCAGVKEPWKMVPNPEHEGLYSICNTKTEKMSTVDELNTAQNNYRVANGVNAVSIDSTLCQVAGQRAEEIATSFSHDGFESAIERNSIPYSSVGENIASGPLSGVRFVEWSWDRSLGHRENMLRDWTRGCGGVYARYAVFIFAK